MAQREELSQVLDRARASIDQAAALLRRPTVDSLDECATLVADAVQALRASAAQGALPVPHPSAGLEEAAHRLRTAVALLNASFRQAQGHFQVRVSALGGGAVHYRAGGLRLYPGLHLQGSSLEH